MCLKFNRTANRIPEASLFPWKPVRGSDSMDTNTHIPSHEDGPEQNSKHEAVVLKMNMVYDEETRMQKERGGDDSLGRRINCAPYEAGLLLSKENDSSKINTP
jgi:hypothetical protein